MEYLKQLIAKGAQEREIQDFLKANLAILGNAHSHPKGEFIVISELPVDDGKCDFVSLSCRSRMSVTFIEIKGADFNFINSNDRFASAINEGAEQIESRLAYLERNYETFRRKIHQLRQAAIDNTCPHNSECGQGRYLGVDPNKDITFHGIVIGGRTVNDSLESELKWNKEKNGSIIRFESWDSWIRKYA